VRKIGGAHGRSRDGLESRRNDSFNFRNPL